MANLAHDLRREAAAEAIGIYSPPSQATCAEHGEVVVRSYVKHCPDELSCGCRFVPEGVPRCAACGWPTPPPVGFAALDQGACGDGRNGCRRG